MKPSFSLKQFVQLAVITAITVVIALLFHIPIPGTTGVITLIDVGIYLAAYLFGPLAGLIVGALSGLLFDFFSGYAVWIPISVLAHGLQGYVFGRLIGKEPSKGTFVIVSIVAGLVMVAGYFIGETVLFQTIGTALTQAPFNLIQVSVASIAIFNLHLFKHFTRKK